MQTKIFLLTPMTKRNVFNRKKHHLGDFENPHALRHSKH